MDCNRANVLPKEVASKINDSTVFQSIKKELEIAVSNLRHTNWHNYWDIFAIKGAIDLSYGIMQTNVGIIVLTIFNAEGRFMGYMISVIGIASILTNIIMLKLNQTVYINDKGYTRILHGSSLLVLSYLGLGLSSLFSIFVFFMATMSISRALLDSTLNEILNSKINNNDKGKMISIFDSILSLTELIAPILSSLIANIYGVQFVILLCSVPAFIGGVIAYGQRNNYFELIFTVYKK
ncbi:hypothetical protein NQ314_017572 [Rhamnusium bicolor]|uniref:Uncharacterized protein n=1 Tax=Rhamnusium bicolor TaxID=1586634 RepID=A0AAV8WVG2_9CUCU|nr:hypothetical protein NQ314_017572 [Rhamnusium bicolor]